MLVYFSSTFSLTKKHIEDVFRLQMKLKVTGLSSTAHKSTLHLSMYNTT